MSLIWSIIGSIIAIAIVYGVTGGIRRLNKGFKESIQSITNVLVENRKINNKASFDEKIAIMHAYLSEVERWWMEADESGIRHKLGRIAADLRSALWFKGDVDDYQLDEIVSLSQELIDKLEEMIKNDKRAQRYADQVAMIKTVERSCLRSNQLMH